MTSHSEHLPIPHDIYRARLVSMSAHVSKTGFCSYDKAKFEISEGTYRGRLIFDTFVSKSYTSDARYDQAIDIGDYRLWQLARAIGKHNDDILLHIRVNEVKYKGNYMLINAIRMVEGI